MRQSGASETRSQAGEEERKENTGSSTLMPPEGRHVDRAEQIRSPTISGRVLTATTIDDFEEILINTLEQESRTYQRNPLGQLTFESYTNFYSLIMRHARLAFLVQDQVSLRGNRLALLRDDSIENVDQAYRSLIQQATLL